MKNAVRFPHLLTSAAILSDLPEAFKEEFLNSCGVRTFDPGGLILGQGDVVDGMFIVAHGAVEITASNSEGQTVLVHMQQQSETFGEIEALCEQPAASSCNAANTVVVLHAPKQILVTAMQEPVFLRNIFGITYGRLLRDNTTKFVDRFSSVEQRLSDYLYRLSVQTPEIAKTQADLAGLLGCARQTLNRELQSLRDKGIIAMRKGRIEVLNRQALFEQANPTDRPATGPKT